MAAKRALVTGANGHIGNAVLRALIEEGWAVAALVREGADQRALTGLDVELRTGDLRDAAAVERATAGVDTLFHVGAVHRNFATDRSFIESPAIEGTRNVLTAAYKHGVRRVVYTSTAATVGFARDPARPLDESHRIDDARSAYVHGKLLAERLALAALAPEVVVLNPSGVFGPRDYRITPATRAILGLAHGDPAFLHVCLTDVRDVARAHVRAAASGRTGERYIVAGEPVAPRQLAAMMSDIAGVRPPTFRPPTLLVRLLGRMHRRKVRKTGADTPFDLDAVDDLAGGHLVYDSTRSRTELGVTYRPPRDVLVDTLRWLLHLGAIKPRVASRIRARLGDAARPDADWAPP